MAAVMMDFLVSDPEAGPDDVGAAAVVVGDALAGGAAWSSRTGNPGDSESNGPGHRMAIFGHHAVSDHVFATVGHVGTQRDAQFGTRDPWRPYGPVTTIGAGDHHVGERRIDGFGEGQRNDGRRPFLGRTVGGIGARQSGMRQAALAPPDTQHASATKTTTIVRATAFMLPRFRFPECTPSQSCTMARNTRGCASLSCQPTGCG